jgi:hypothetical protein
VIKVMNIGTFVSSWETGGSELKIRVPVIHHDSHFVEPHRILGRHLSRSTSPHAQHIRQMGSLSCRRSDTARRQPLTRPSQGPGVCVWAACTFSHVRITKVNCFHRQVLS